MSWWDRTFLRFAASHNLCPSWKAGCGKRLQRRDWSLGGEAGRSGMGRGRSWACQLPPILFLLLLLLLSFYLPPSYSGLATYGAYGGSQWSPLLFMHNAGALRRGNGEGPLWRMMMGRKRGGEKKKGTGGKRTAGGKGGGADDDGDNDEQSMDGSGDSYAPRVSSNINIPVRRQIAFAKQMKKLVQEESSSKPAAPPKKVRIKKKEEGQRKGMASDYAPFSPLQATCVLLVDGYNVINNWSKTIKARSAGGMPHARQVLVEQLRFIYHARGWKVMVAFDEHTPGSELRVLEGDLDEVYTGEKESADSFIQKKAVELSRLRHPPTVMIATDDRAIQVVSAVPGAKIMSTSSLIKDIYVARKELIHRRTEWKDGERKLGDADDYFTYNWDGTIK